MLFAAWSSASKSASDAKSMSTSICCPIRGTQFAGQMSGAAEMHQPSDHPTFSPHLSSWVKGEDRADPMRGMQNATAMNDGVTYSG